MGNWILLMFDFLLDEGNDLIGKNVLERQCPL